LGAGQAAVAISVLGWYTPYVGDGAAGTSLTVMGDSITALSTPMIYNTFSPTMNVSSLGLTGFQAREVEWWADIRASSTPDRAIINLGTNDAWIGAPYPAAS